MEYVDHLITACNFYVKKKPSLNYKMETFQILGASLAGKVRLVMSARHCQDVFMVHVEIIPIPVIVKKTGKVNYVMNQFASI